MAIIANKYKGKSKYKHVYSRINYDKTIYYAVYRGWNSKAFDNEKDAAKSVDIRLIQLGKEPVNILSRK